MIDLNHADAHYLVDWTGYSMVEVNPAKLSGTPTLKGWRMPAQFIIENYMLGDSADEIAESFGLPKEDVRSLIAEAIAKNPELLRR